MLKQCNSSRPMTSERPSSAIRRRGVRLATPLLMLALAAQAFAAQPAAPDDPSGPAFLIETIVVEKSEKFPPSIVISESLLETGKTYTESELRDAIHRIVRLPLILDADFSLRKGTERDLYQLVIAVTEARRWFFGVENIATARGEPISISGLETTDYTVGDVSLVGYRVPAGGSGVFFVTAGGADGGFQIGYTHNNLFRRNVLLSFKAAFTECADVHAGNESYELGEDGCATEVFSLGLDPTFSS